jgi:biotin transporter BioY
MKTKLAKLIDVKSIVTLTLTGVFAFITISGIDVPDTFETIYVMIIGFYFGTQSAKKVDSNVDI